MTDLPPLFPLGESETETEQSTDWRQEIRDLARMGIAMTALVLVILVIFYPLSRLLWWLNDHAPVMVVVAVGAPTLIFAMLGLTLLVGRVVEWIDHGEASH